MSVTHYFDNIEKRKKFSKLYEKKVSLSDIAILLEICQRTAYKELSRGFVGYDRDGRKTYDPYVAQSVFEENLSRRGRKPNTFREDEK